MLEMASGYRPDVVDGRWVIETRHAGKSWEAIVEPEWQVEAVGGRDGVPSLGELR
jgi:hypothetical protein